MAEAFENLSRYVYWDGSTFLSLSSSLSLSLRASTSDFLLKTITEILLGSNGKYDLHLICPMMGALISYKGQESCLLCSLV